MWFLHRRPNRSGEEAKAALEEAKKTLLEVQERSEEVTTIANDLKLIRERNHFAEHLEELLYRQRGRPLHDT